MKRLMIENKPCIYCGELKREHIKLRAPMKKQVKCIFAPTTYLPYDNQVIMKLLQEGPYASTGFSGRTTYWRFRSRAEQEYEIDCYWRHQYLRTMKISKQALEGTR